MSFVTFMKKIQCLINPKSQAANPNFNDINNTILSLTNIITTIMTNKYINHPVITVKL